MKLYLKIWRQLNTSSKGEMVNYEIDGVSEHMSFLEMLDLLNESLIQKENVLLNLITIAEKEFAVNVVL